ncbi:hypothetical protein MBEHAL_1737 [Halarchaeum acidiphilum MH1-52-1]|uniref:Uncharacterized protein n=1 Tax=Halarchaeum acidiphilum MH1-52-1 TaxID=1261545 RepID=U2YW21_9EURY|nr:hypothetical protein [Halarchaeum acidiphilum]GAD52977.1 hypothetical protein MBEHAL_1737 [Halarchaeum acidiphilum MH1-52-1]
MNDGTLADVLVDILLNVQLMLSTVAFVLSLVAARGYAGSPWGRVLRLMPVLIGCLVTVDLLQRAVPDAIFVPASGLLWTVATITIVLMTSRLVAMVRRAEP